MQGKSKAWLVVPNIAMSRCQCKAEIKIAHESSLVHIHLLDR